MSKPKLYRNKAWLYKMYIVQKNPLAEIARVANCSEGTIYYWMKKLNIPLRKRNDIVYCVQAPYRDREWLYQLYHVQKRDGPEIARMANCCSTTIYNWMNKLNIPRRTSTEVSQALSQSPMWRRKQLEGILRRSQDPGWHRNVAQAAQRRAQDPEYRRKYIEAMQRLAQDSEWHKNVTEAARRRSQNPEWRHNVTQAARRRVQDPKYLEAMRRRWQDPEFRKKHAEAMRRLHQDPAWQKARAEANRRQAQDPAWQKAVAEANRRLALKKRNQGEMTNIEAICHAAFESLGLEFVFEKFIYPYRVDFFFPSHGVIVEAMGKYWHNRPEQQEHDAERKQYLEASGYVVLEWWGPDIKADVYKLIDEELLPLLDQPSRIERPPRGVSRPYRGPHGWQSAVQLSLFDKEPNS